MAEARPKKGDIVAVAINDHRENGDDAMPCMIYGRIVGNTRKVYKVATRAAVGDDTPFNTHYFILIKRAVTSIAVLQSKTEGSD